jgi:hypothetical protein
MYRDIQRISITQFILRQGLDFPKRYAPLHHQGSFCIAVSTLSNKQVTHPPSHHPQPKGPALAPQRVPCQGRLHHLLWLAAASRINAFVAGASMLPAAPSMAGPAASPSSRPASAAGASRASQPALCKAGDAMGGSRAASASAAGARAATPRPSPTRGPPGVGAASMAGAGKLKPRSPWPAMAGLSRASGAASASGAGAKPSRAPASSALCSAGSPRRAAPASASTTKLGAQVSGLKGQLNRAPAEPSSPVHISSSARVRCTGSPPAGAREGRQQWRGAVSALWAETMLASPPRASS